MPVSSLMRSKLGMHKNPTKLQSAMREVHKNIPKNVTKTGKTGKAKEKMLEAIAFSKSRRNR